MSELLPNGYIRAAVPINDPKYPNLHGIGGFVDISPEDPEYEKHFMFLPPDDVTKARSFLERARARLAKAAAGR